MEIGHRSSDHSQGSRSLTLHHRKTLQSHPGVKSGEAREVLKVLRPSVPWLLPLRWPPCGGPRKPRPRVLSPTRLSDRPGVLGAWFPVWYSELANSFMSFHQQKNHNSKPATFKEHQGASLLIWWGDICLSQYRHWERRRNGCGSEEESGEAWLSGRNARPGMEVT